MVDGQLGFFDEAPKLPEGFRYQPDLITPQDEQHSIPGVEALRYSITFRNLKAS